VKLDSVSLNASDGMEAPILYFSGVDLVDGTPIYDVKPYLAYAESVPDAKSGYAQEPPTKLEVKIDEAALSDFSELDQRSQRIVREVLALDPRPAASPQDEAREYGALLCGKNIKFRFSDQLCWIIGVESI